MKSEMTTELESGGPRSLVFIDTSLGAPQRSKVVKPRHITQRHATTGNRKVLPPYVEFDSTAAEENMGVDVRW
eukprot:3650358-Prymnesium_polylepis.1